MILRSKRLVVFTGAGISTESGVADFRSPGGIWERFDPNELNYQSFLASEEGREKYWQFSRVLWTEIAKAQPNAGHHAIAELHRLGKLECLITQNIDSLHQKSGVPEEKIIELHGTLKWVNCLECGQRYPREQIQARLDSGTKVPRCDSCQGIMKPATVAFGQPMPEEETRQAEAAAAACDLFLSVGSSLVVYPAAQMPLIAKDNGARLVIINLTPTPHDHYADIVIQEKTGPALSRIAKKVKALLS
ncbi:MAG TPA: NAD-dependent protein deacylase [Dehalococcoidia bacterium]|nr:NAD-dependent protein deacylase [Dehalococcoidia bacterium]